MPNSRYYPGISQGSLSPGQESNREYFTNTSQKGVTTLTETLGTFRIRPSDTSVDIATGYGLDDLGFGFESR
jgi:hypothetical protein